MKYLNIEKEALESKGAEYTASEIVSQPELWRSIYDKIVKEENEIKDFFQNVVTKVDKVILTGAGTSAFIGNSVEGIFKREQKVVVQSIATTHLVSHPLDYFDKEVPTLLVSFARSGDSPESVASVKLADQMIDKCYHLVITCNPEGELANYIYNYKSLVFVLPEGANDKSLAMTASYSGMLLSALLMNQISNIQDQEQAVNKIVGYGNKILSDYAGQIEEIAKKPFKRAVFLGAGPLYGTALESELKLQELTDGSVICKHDSFLGFRHGPKAVVDESTLLVYFFSNNLSSYRYERDLVNSMRKGKPCMYQIGISENEVDDIEIDKVFTLSNDSEKVEEYYLSVPYILFSQILGFYKSLILGLTPDSPSKSGAISRVVEGVVIY